MAPGATTPTTAITGIRADLLKQKTIPVKDFLRIILDVSEGVTEDLLSLGADQNLRRLLENYDPSNITHETELYRPFVELANSRLDNLSGQEIRLVRNDPKIVLGSAAARKPDLATISSTSLLLGERDSPDNLAENGPAHPFHWLELVGFWEFNWLGRKLSSRAPAISRKTTWTAPRSTKSTSPAATPVTLGNILFMAHGLIGRRTCVLYGSRNNTAVIVKISWPSKSRIIEASIIRSAIEHAEKSETWVFQHLPSFRHDEQHEHPDKSPQSRLLAYLGADLYESRILRISIQEVLQPIVELTTPTTVVKAFRDIFNAYRWLYEQLKIMHRDVSLANLMFRIGKEGTVLGVLNDFDLAVYVEASGLQSTYRHRTGTRPFMARDFLQPAADTPRYVYRYDLESIYYCILLLTSSYDGGKKIPKSLLDQWFQASPSELLNFKSYPIPPLPTKTFYSVRLWTVGLCDMFAKGDGARGEHRRADIVAELMKEEEPAPFDDETLGGVVTFEKFAAILALEIK